MQKSLTVPKSKKGEVTLGRTVIFKELPDGILEEYTIVGKAEADPFSGKIYLMNHLLLKHY